MLMMALLMITACNKNKWEDYEGSYNIYYINKDHVYYNENNPVGHIDSDRHYYVKQVDDLFCWTSDGIYWKCFPEDDLLIIPSEEDDYGSG